MSVFSWSSELMFAWVMTYLIHSTVLLFACWLTFRFLRSPSHTLSERAWKIAAMTSLLTTAIQIQWDQTGCFTWELAATESVSVDAWESLHTDGSSSRSDSPSLATQWCVRTSVDPTVNPTVDTSATMAEARLKVSVQPGESDAGLTSALRPAMEDPAMESPNLGGLGLIEWTSVWKRVLVLLAALWIGFGFFRLAAAFAMLHWKVRHLHRLQNGRSRELLDRLLERNRIKHRVELRVGGDQSDPIALGIRNWMIIVPVDFESALADDEQEAALAHELAHLVRRDVIWLWVGQLLTTCLGFQPLNFVARRRWQQASEFLCDQWAIGHGAARLSLAKSLTTLAAMKIARNKLTFALAATGTQATLARRVKRLVSHDEMIDSWQSTTKTRLTWIVALLVVLVMPMAVPGIRAAKPPNSSSDPNTGSAPRQADSDNPSIEVYLNEGIPITDFESFMRLDLELAALNAELAVVADLADQDSEAKEIADQIARIRAVASSLQRNRQGLSKHFSQESME